MSRGCLTSQRDLEVLRLLGRIEFGRPQWIHRLIYPDYTLRWTRMVLQRLYLQRLIWRAPAPARRVAGSIGSRNQQPAPQAPMIYGLAPAGRTLLTEAGVEADPLMPTTFPVRPWDAPDLRLRQIGHDLLVSDWCCAMVYGARVHPAVMQVDCRVEYISAVTPTGQATQRFDALLTLVITPSRTWERTPGTIPWPNGLLAPADAVTCHFAGEIDTGSEKLAILMAKAGTYRALTLSGHYQNTLGGTVLPVILVPSGTRRAAQVAREWMAGWPDGAGIISSFSGAQVGHNALHGRYLTITPHPRPVFLLEPWGWTRSAWDAQIIATGMNRSTKG